MANKFYPLGAEKILSGQINFPADTIKATLVTSAYTYSATDEFLSSLGALVGPQVTLTGKTVGGGVFNADDLEFGAIAPGSTIKALVLYVDMGSAATSPLLCYFDEVTGFPFTTNGGDVNTPWSKGAYKILSLV